MAKSEAKEIATKAKASLPPTLKQNFNLWYKSSGSRTLRTINKLYFSSPYFTPSESNLIKVTLVRETSDIKATHRRNFGQQIYPCDSRAQGRGKGNS